MDRSLYLARLLGPVFAIAGLGMFTNSASAALLQQIMQSDALLYVTAFIGLVAGVALVLAHNVWAADWRVIITLIGWMTLLDSAQWILFPEFARGWEAALIDSPWTPLLGGILIAAIGVILSYFGYAAKPAAGRRRK